MKNVISNIKISVKHYWVCIVLAIYLVFILIYSIAFIISGGKNYLLASNELGDFLAGIISPVAFLFLILGYLQQRNVIAENTKILSEQIEELKLSKLLMKKTNQPKFVITIRKITYERENSLLKLDLNILNTHQECIFLGYEFLDEDFNIGITGIGFF